MMGAVLVVFVAADAVEGVVQSSDGHRTRIAGDGTDIGSLSLPLVEGVARAREALPELDKATTGRTLWSRRIKALLAAAEQASGQPIVALRLIVPPALDEEDAQSIILAGHLAGCPRVDAIGVEQCLSDKALTPIGRRHLLVQWDRRRLTVCAYEIGAVKPAIVARATLSDALSGEVLAGEVLDDMELFGAVRDKAMTAMVEALAQPSSAPPAQSYVANDRGAPDVVFVGQDIRHDVQRRVAARIAEILAEARVGLDGIDVIHLQGALAPGLAQHFTARSPGVEIQVSNKMAAALEIAPVPTAETARLGGDVIVDAGIADRVSAAQATKTITARAGEALPLTRIFDSFPTARIFEDFSLYYDDGAGGDLVIVGVPAIPPLLETKAFSRLRLRVMADTERHLILSVNVGGLVDDSFIFDKTQKRWERIEDGSAGALGMPRGGVRHGTR